MTAIILIRPQMGENIGAAARVMLNFGLKDLRLVAPRDGWPNPKAVDMSSGAIDKINVSVYDDIAGAVADRDYLYATTSRRRDMEKEVTIPAGIELTAKTGIIFGPERTGIENDEISICDRIIEIPVNPDFPSLNLAQSVAVLCYAISSLPPRPSVIEPAPKEEIFGFFGHLEEELTRANFFSTPEKKPTMMNNIHTMFSRAALTSQEVRTLRGIIRSLVRNGNS